MRTRTKFLTKFLRWPPVPKGKAGLPPIGPREKLGIFPSPRAEERSEFSKSQSLNREGGFGIFLSPYGGPKRSSKFF